MGWFSVNKPEKRLNDINDEIHEQQVALLNAQLQAAAAKGKLEVLLAAKAELEKQMPAEVPSVIMETQ